ncbi:MAG: heparinase [Planctomycetes bacterium]|nr:heparinase [Planctomycetota bacterium]
MTTALIGSVSALAEEKNATPEPFAALATLDQNHPRLMLKDEDLARLKERHKTDRVLQKYVREVLKRADDYLEAPTLTHTKKGPRLLHVSRECLHRVYALGLAWRWTGQDKYARKATENLVTVCSFGDWNPSHFLDTAEMSHAVGLGYDWLFHYFDPETRERIRSGLIELGMEPGIEQYTKVRTIYTIGRAIKEEGIGASWTRANGNLGMYNWNQVCNGGLLVGSLAIAETDPKYAKFIISKAVTILPNALRTYGPDGAWPEGRGYWGYATRYTAYGLAAMRTALENDFGLSQIPGLSVAGFFPIHLDSPLVQSQDPTPCLFWLARTYQNPLFADYEHAVLDEHPGGARPEHVIWYTPPSGNNPYPDALDSHFRGSVESATFRSAWNDPEALFVHVRAGYNQINHAKLELGHFDMDALGVHWAINLGRDDYNLPGWWERLKGGQRWTYYRANSLSRNVPQLNGQIQDPMARANFIKTEINTSTPFVLVDLTDAYDELAEHVTRGIAIVNDRRAVLVQDEFELKGPCEAAWGMTTDAAIDIRGDGVALLALDGEELVARVLSPAGAEFIVESAEQELPQNPNTGIDRLMVRVPGAKGSVRLAVLLSPVWKENG